jgi:two-component system, LuxR family, response regulator FixJ
MIRATVAVVDDDREVRESLAALIGATHLDVECYDSGRAFLDRCGQSPPACVVLDLRLPQQSGLDVLGELSSRRINVPVIMISAHGDIRAAVDAMKAGALDFFEKPYRAGILLESIRRAIELNRRDRQARASYERVRAILESLTPQEREVLRLTISGKPDKAIAQRLDVSLRTIQLRRAGVMRRLNVRSRAELICLAHAVQPGTS